MKNNITEIVFILDKSGSMAGFEDDTVGGFNSVIAEHKEGDKVRSPGVKYTHYKPKCKTALFNENQKEQVIKLYKEYQSQGKKPYIMCADFVSGFEGLNLLRLGRTPKEIASNLYDKLLLGEKIADIIIAVAMPDEKGINLGIMNRLKRSCDSGEL